MPDESKVIGTSVAAASGAREATTWRTIERDLAPRVGAREARWMIERASGYDAAELSRSRDEVPLHRQVGFLDAMVERRLAGEPLQYVLGRWPFRSLELIVDRRVLIPRPETEVVAGIAIDHLRGLDLASGPSTVVDLGTGSGAIGLAVATEVLSAQVWCTDASSGRARCGARQPGRDRTGGDARPSRRRFLVRRATGRAERHDCADRVEPAIRGRRRQRGRSRARVGTAWCAVRRP